MTEADVVRLELFWAHPTGELWRVKALGRTGRARPVEATGAACKATPEGYRVVSVGPNRFKAHRIIWHILRGPIPDDMEVNHKNGKRGDNRIENLDLVTKGENLAHAYRQLGRVRPSGERNGRSKLTAEQAAEIRADSAGARVLARRYGVSATTVKRIRRGEMWRDELPPMVPRG